MLTALPGMLADGHPVSDFFRDFATSPAGWLAGICTPLIFGLIVRKSSRDARRHEDVTRELRKLHDDQASQTGALNVLVENVRNGQVNLARVPELDREVASLRAQVDALERSQSRGGGS